MTNKAQYLILFFLGILTGAVLHWLVDVSVSLAGDSTVSPAPFRVVASTRGPHRSSARIKPCDQIKNIESKDTIDIYCSVTTEKEDRGVRYRVRSNITVKKASTDKKATISVRSKLRDTEEHLTEADYCGDCSEDRTVDLSELNDLKLVSQAIQNQVASALDKEDDRIESAVDSAYDRHRRKQRLKQRIAKCEISPRSTLRKTRAISAEEKIQCRKDQLEDIENPRDRTRYFHSTVKKDLWNLVQTSSSSSVGRKLSDYMQDLNNPNMFDYDYFSVRSSLDTVMKYNDLRTFMRELGDNKLVALDSISQQMPYYFHTSKRGLGRTDRLYLEQAWNRDFPERQFPDYYSLSKEPATRHHSQPTRRRGMSAEQFRSIVNSQRFQKLYRQ